MTKAIYVLIGLWGLTHQALGQTKLFRGHWYIGTELGIVNSNTRMATGELSLYAPGWSGVMPTLGLKAGYTFAPYFSVESGVSSLPINLVYLYKTDKVIGTNPLNFVSVPLRLKGRVYVFNNQLEAYVTAGVHFIYTNSTPKSFTGTLITPRHTYSDTLRYNSNVTLVRRSSVAAELGVGINWTLSSRWRLNIFGRRLMGLVNVAEVNVAIQENGETPSTATFLSRGSSFSMGVGMQYQFRLRK